MSRDEGFASRVLRWFAETAASNRVRFFAWSWWEPLHRPAPLTPIEPKTTCIVWLVLNEEHRTSFTATTITARRPQLHLKDVVDATMRLRGNAVHACGFAHVVDPERGFGELDVHTIANECATTVGENITNKHVESPSGTPHGSYRLAPTRVPSPASDSAIVVLIAVSTASWREWADDRLGVFASLQALRSLNMNQVHGIDIRVLPARDETLTLAKALDSVEKLRSVATRAMGIAPR